MWTVALALALALAACGRFGFDARTGAADASDDTAASDATPFVEAKGSLDPTFGTAGITVLGNGGEDFRPFDVFAGPAGGYVTSGTHASGAVATFELVGYTADGQFDPAFGIRNLGPTGNDFGYRSMRLGQQFVVVGDGDDGAGTNDDVTVAMVDDTGTGVPGFGPGGFRRFDLMGASTADTAQGVTALGGDILVCGTMAYDQPDGRLALLRVSPTGQLVTSWGAGGLVLDDFQANVVDECLDARPLGTRLIVAGHSGQRLVIAAYDATGARDPAFGTNGFVLLGAPFSGAYAMTIADGDIVVVGENNGQGYAVRLAPDGSPRASFGVNGEQIVAGTDALFAVIPQPDGKLIVAGERGTKGVIARVLADGSPDLAFGTSGVVEITVGPSLALQGLLLEPAGRLVAVGTSSAAHAAVLGDRAARVARGAGPRQISGASRSSTSRSVSAPAADRPCDRGSRPRAALVALQPEHPLLDRARDDQIVDEHRLGLADPVRAIGGLRLRRRVPPRVVVDHGVGAGEVEPCPAGLERDQEHVGAARLERVDRLLAIRRVPGQRDVADAAARAAPRRSAPSMRANCEKIRMRRPSPSWLPTSSSSTSSLALRVTPRAASTDDQPRIAADLAQLEQRVEDRDGASRRGRAALMCWRTSACAATRMLS